MKIIRYQHNALQFKIPDHWEEEYDAEGTGIYYKDVPDSGTLRVFLISTDAEEDETETSEQFARTIDVYNGLPIIKASQKDVIVRNEERMTEDGVYLILYFFDRIHKTKDDRFEIAHFSWVIEERFEHEQHYQNDLKLITELVADARFSH